MHRYRVLCALGLLAGLAACDRPTEPHAAKIPDPAPLTAQQPQDKVGDAVWAALDRGESPAVIVSLRVPSNRDLGMQRREVAAAQSGVLNGVPAQALTVRRRFSVVPAFSAKAHDRAALRRLAADPRVSRIDLDEGGRGTLRNAVLAVRAHIRHNAGNRGAGVTVAILDTGVDYLHPDLAGAFAGGACFGDNDGDIDGKGFCINGVDRATGLGAAEDDAGHGTHVAGIVASRGTVSGPGFAPGATLFPIKVLDNCSFSGCFSYLSEVVAALDYIADFGFGVDIVNMSLGTSATYEGTCDNADAGAQATKAAVDALNNAGVTVFAASGNDGSDTEMGIPACLSNVIAVGSVDNADNIASTSNHTPTTDILAPGVGIVSLGIGGGTMTASGTSMASPAAAGCAALLIESGEATTPAAILARLRTSTVSLTRGGTSIPRIDCSPPNSPPVLSVANAIVNVDEGLSVMNVGTASDVDFDTITLTASIGTVQRTSSGWIWNFTASDGPTQSQVVTITADDGRGGTTSVTFDLVVNNVAPAVSTGTSMSIVSNTTFSFSGSFADAFALDGPWTWSIAWGVGADTFGSATTNGSTIAASRRFCVPGTYDVTLSVTDRDDGTGIGVQRVTVTAIPVGIDITPTDSPNSVSLSNKGQFPVAVLSTASFDAARFDVATVTLGDAAGQDTPVALRSNGRPFATLQDVNGDGRRDLVLQFAVPALVANGDLTSASTSLVLQGTLTDGCSAMRGLDAVRVVP